MPIRLEPSAAFVGGRGIQPVQTGLTITREKNHPCQGGCNKRFVRKHDMLHHMSAKHPECKGTHQYPLTAPSFSSVSSAPSILSPVPLVEDALQPNPLKRSYNTAVTPGLEALPSVPQTSVSYNDEILKLSCKAGAWFTCGKKRTRRVTASDEMEPDEMGTDPVNLIAHHLYADLVSVQKGYDDDLVRKKRYDEQDGINALASRTTFDQKLMPQGIIANNVSGIFLFEYSFIL